MISNETVGPARAKNALLKRLCRDKTGVSVPTPNNLVNDTGTRDLVFTKKPAPQHQTRESASLPPSPTPSRSSTSSADVNAFVQNAIHNALVSLVERPIQDQEPKSSVTDFARQYAEGIIQQDSMTSSILEDMAEAVVTVSLTNIVAEQRASMCQIQAESQSFTSSMASELAEATVRDSLTHIMAGNTNESASPKRKWIRTANEYIDMLEIAPFPDKSDSLTRVD